MKIKILYSHLNVSGTDNKVRPAWFDFEKCFQNLISTGVRGDYINVIYDTTRGGVEQNWIDDYLPLVKGGKAIKGNFANVHPIQGGSMMGAAKEMYRIAKELSSDMEDGDLFYFLENDYLHVTNWVEKITELFEMYKLNGGYVSLYDHPDKYTSLYQDLISKIIVTDSHHWRTTPSTCGSYVVNKKTFLEDYDVLTNVEGDHNKWLHLAENKGRYILSPIPSLSTHCMSQHLAPTIKWEEINNG